MTETERLIKVLRGETSDQFHALPIGGIGSARRAVNICTCLK